MNKILDIVSIIGSFLIVFSLLFLIQELTFGQINSFRNVIVFNFLHLKDLVFTATSLLFIAKFIRFYTPDRT